MNNEIKSHKPWGVDREIDNVTGKVSFPSEQFYYRCF